MTSSVPHGALLSRVAYDSKLASKLLTQSAKGRERQRHVPPVGISFSIWLVGTCNTVAQTIAPTEVALRNTPSGLLDSPVERSNLKSREAGSKGGGACLAGAASPVAVPL